MKTKAGLISLIVLAFLLPCIFLNNAAIAKDNKDDPKEAAAFKALLTSKAPKPQNLVTTYETSGSRRFTLDRSNRNIVLLKFDNSDEVWALNPISGPRGDEFLRNDIGVVMVRITSLGGVTLYTKKDSGGMPAVSKNKGNSIKTLEQTYSGNIRRVVSDATDRFEEYDIIPPKIEIKDDLPPALVNESILRIFDALEAMPNGDKASKSIKIIRFNRAPQCFVLLSKGVLEIGLTPGISYSGRPSSLAIRSALGG